jgi:hypothetical protein
VAGGAGGAGEAAGLLPLVKHAVDKVVKGANRNCCCCIPCTHVAGRLAPDDPHTNCPPENGGGERKQSAELVAAVHAGALDASIQRVAILDLDGRSGLGAGCGLCAGCGLRVRAPPAAAGVGG